METITDWEFKGIRNEKEDYTIFYFQTEGGATLSYKIDNIRHLIESADKVGNSSGI